MEDQSTMEELLYESIEARWGKEQLPSVMELAIEARQHFNLDFGEAATMAKSITKNHKSDLETMGYTFPGEDSLPHPPKYEG